MKRLFAVIMSLQLILAPVALAQGNGDQYRENSGGGNSTASYMKQILGLSTGIIGSNILTTCALGSSQPSLYIYMAGALVLIGSEIFAGKSQSQLKDKKTKDIAMLEEKLKEMTQAGGDLQKEMLEQALQEEEETKKFIKNRKNWMTAIAVIYWAAMAMAIIEEWLSWPTPAGTGKSAEASCSTGNKTVDKILTFAVIAAWSWGSSKAGGGGTISTIGGFATALIPIVDASGKIVSTAYSSAIGRAITFGVSGGLATWIAADLGNKQKTVEGNIEKLKNTIKNLKTTTEPTTEIAEDLPGTEENTTNEKPEIKRLTTELPKSCFSNTSQGMDYSESGCKKPFKVPKANFGTNFNVPTLSNVSNLANQMAQAVSDGNMADADLIAGQIAGMAAQVKKVKDQVMKERNDRAKLIGKTPEDIEKGIKTQMAALESAFMKATNSNPSGMASTNNPSLDDLAKESSGDVKQEVVAAVAPTSTAPVPAMAGFSESGIEEDPAARNGVSISEGLDQFETNVQDIATTPEVSIFKQVSNRYILNYSKIFDRRKEIEPVPEQQKN